MSGPAVEAAHRAWDATAPHRRPFTTPTIAREYATAAAREALAPVRARLDRLAEETRPLTSGGNWAEYYEAFVQAISDISEHVYAADELTDE